MDQKASGFTPQTVKEEAAFQQYRAAQLAFITGPKE